MPPTEPVRTQLRLRSPRRRTLEQRFAVRFPRAYARFTRAIHRLPVGSRVRQAVLSRGIEFALAATNRGDFEAVLPAYDPDVEFVVVNELVGLGLGEGRNRDYRGHEGFREIWQDWEEDWARRPQWNPVELIDLGERIVMLGRMEAVGRASGADVAAEIAVVWTFRDGKVVREQHFVGPDREAEALAFATSAK